MLLPHKFGKKLLVIFIFLSFVWRCMPDCSPAHIFTQKARTHTKSYAAASTHWLLHFNKF